MQLLEIVLYSNIGDMRTLSLRPGKVNIITGGSAKGKSALIDIIDYCLGRKECMVAEGIIRETVSWYGLKLQFPSTQLFIARENPKKGKKTTNRAYLELGENIRRPEYASLKPNTNIETVIAHLTNLIGISPNRYTPPHGQTREPIEANIRHCLTYCFQQQGEIASKNILFHRQEESFLEQRIKDTLPYFLGAIREDQLAIEQEITRVRRELKRAGRTLAEANSVKGDGMSKAISLLSEAQEAGIISIEDPPRDAERIIPILEKISKWNPEDAISIAPSRLTQLHAELSELKAYYNYINEEILKAKSFAHESEGFTVEVSQQKLRLQSIGLFAEDYDPFSCPLCNHKLNMPLPSASAIHNSIKEINTNLESISKEQPRLREYMEELEGKKENMRIKIKQIKEEINGIYNEQTSDKIFRDKNVQYGKILGKIDFWLENVGFTDDLSEMQKNTDEIKARLAYLEAQIDPEEKEERLTSILYRIGIQMTEWARILELEHSNNPVHLDIKKATIIIDREDRPIPLQRMGSGENWVGYHIVTHLALHKHFSLQSRPVPRFLFLDQPSQAYFPKDISDSSVRKIENLKDEDREALYRLYKLIFDVVDELNSEMQVIITDHAELNDERFKSTIIEQWWGDKALIPREWE